MRDLKAWKLQLHSTFDRVEVLFGISVILIVNFILGQENLYRHLLRAHGCVFCLSKRNM